MPYVTQFRLDLQFPITGTLEQLRSQFPRHIILLRLGDYAEAFDADAETVAEVCDVMLTSRKIRKGQRQPMAGVPWGFVRDYIKMLTDAGYSVALAEPYE